MYRIGSMNCGGLIAHVMHNGERVAVECAAFRLNDKQGRLCIVGVVASQEQLHEVCKRLVTDAGMPLKGVEELLENLYRLTHDLPESTPYPFTPKFLEGEEAQVFSDEIDTLTSGS